MQTYYKHAFPLLSEIDRKKTTDSDGKYNCVAWAFGDMRRWWWPDKRRCYWPLDATGRTCLRAFEELFATWGWAETEDRSAEQGVQKIALYVLLGEPTHAARLLPNGVWTSKLGAAIDISHNHLNELNGPKYGSVYKIYRKTAT